MKQVLAAAMIALASANAFADKPPVISGSCTIKPSSDGKPPVVTGSCTNTPKPTQGDKK